MHTQATAQRQSNDDLTHDIVPPELENPADGVPDDGAPEVSHVHFLRDVGAGEVDHHALCVGDPATTDDERRNDIERRRKQSTTDPQRHGRTAE